MKSLKEFKPLYQFIEEDKWKLILAAILIFITELSNTLGGYLNGRVVEEVTNKNLKLALIFLGIYFLICIFIDVLLSSKANATLLSLENKISRKLSFNTYKKSVNLPAYAYEKTSSGEIINRIVNDADSLSFTFGRLLNLFTSFIGSIIIIVYIFINSWLVGVEIIIAVIILFFVIKKYNPLLKQIHKDRKKQQDEFSSLVNESIRGVREIKTLGIKNNLISDMSFIIKAIFNKSNEEIDTSTKYDIIVRLIKAILESLVFATCAYLVYKGYSTLTFFVSMTYYVYRFMWLIENITSFTQTYQKLTVSLERVNEILENRLYEDEKFGNMSINDCKGYISFENVNFGYPNEEKLLNDFNIKLEPNKKIAIVGKSGQGKSTLFNLLTRIFDPNEGHIYLDDIDIKDLSEEELRKEISIIRQEPFIFNRSILDNFRIINKDIKLDEVRKYTKMAFLDDYIMSLPKKYDTVLGEGGVNLSGGQKQRLSIARTLAKKSKVILFDEATSALDNESQNYIKESIDNLVKDHTVIIVAHRLSTIVDADIIYVIDKGKVVSSGSHNKLLKTSKVYKKLYTTESFN